MSMNSENLGLFTHFMSKKTIQSSVDRGNSPPPMPQVTEDVQKTAAPLLAMKRLLPNYVGKANYCAI